MNILIQRMIIQKILMQPNIDHLNVSRGDFSKYAILNGFYGKKLISRDARKFYSSMCRMAVKKEKGFYVISDEYEFAETSYKNVIFFCHGYVSNKNYCK